MNKGQGGISWNYIFQQLGAERAGYKWRIKESKSGKGNKNAKVINWNKKADKCHF